MRLASASLLSSLRAITSTYTGAEKNDPSCDKSHVGIAGGPETCTSSNNGNATALEGSSSAYSSATTVSCYNSSPITPLEDGAVADKGFATWDNNGSGDAQAENLDQHSVKIQRVPSALALTRPSISPILSAGATRTSSTVINDSSLCPAGAASSSSHVTSTHLASAPTVASLTNPDGASPKASTGASSSKSDSDFGTASCGAASNKPASPAKSVGPAVKKEDDESACESKENASAFEVKNNPPKDKAVFDQKFDQKLSSRDQDARGDEDATQTQTQHEKRKCDVKRLSKSEVECEGSENENRPVHILVDSRCVCMFVCMSVCLCACVCACVFVFVHVCVFVCMYVSVLRRI